MNLYQAALLSTKSQAFACVSHEEPRWAGPLLVNRPLYVMKVTRQEHEENQNRVSYLFEIFSVLYPKREGLEWGDPVVATTAHYSRMIPHRSDLEIFFALYSYQLDGWQPVERDDKLLEG